MPADYSKMHRLLRLLVLMQQGGAGGAASLARQLGVSERTIYRDLEILADLGVPCFFDDDAKGYRIRKDFFLPPVHLTVGESLALFVLTQGVAEADQIAMTGPAVQAMEKLRAQLPEKVLREIGDVDQHLEVKLPPTGPAVEAIHDVFERVRDALGRRRALECRYESLNPETNDDEPFLLEPYTLSFDQRSWYVIGHHSRRGEIRRLKLNRFTAIALTDRPYAIPEDFSPAAYRGNAWRMIRGEPTCDVVIDFDATVAETVSDTHWHPTQQIEEHPDGSITFRCTVDGLDEIVWWILGYGPLAHVREPQHLAQKVSELVRATGENYLKSPLTGRCQSGMYAASGSQGRGRLEPDDGTDAS